MPHDAAPSPASLRRELLDLVVADLLGPAGGEREALDGRERVAVRYLLGMLAPRGTIATDAARVDRHDVADGDGTAEGPGADDLVAQAALFPGSFGLTFAVRLDERRLRVRASWGKYLKETGHRQPAGCSFRRDPGAWTVLSAEMQRNRPAC